MARTANISGLANLKKQLTAMPQAIKLQIADAMAVSAGEVVDFAISLAPYKELKDSIGWAWGTRVPKGKRRLASISKSGLGVGQSVVGSRDDLAITIYAGDDDAFYARWVEFGTKPHSLARGAIAKRNKRQGEGRQHPGTKAVPFFFPAWRALQKRAKSRITRAINKAVKSAAAK